MFSHVFPKSHLLCNRYICVPVYKYSTVTKKMWGNVGESDYDTQTANVGNVLSVLGAKVTKEGLTIGMQNVILYHRISYHLFPSPFSVYTEFGSLVSQRITWG